MEEASPANTAASPSPAKSRRHKKEESAATAASSPAPSPAATAAAKSRARKKAAAPETAAATAPTMPTPAPVASATPKPNILGRFFNKPSPTAAPVAAASPAMGKSGATAPVQATPMPGGGHGMVWVNTETKVFHREGSRYYGKTKQGKYMTEEEALKAGYRPPTKGQ